MSGVEHLQQAFLWLIDTYGYLGLFVALALGNIGVPVGTEIVLPVAGAPIFPSASATNSPR